MQTFSDLQGLVDATETRKTLEQVEKRKLYQQADAPLPDLPTVVPGTRYVPVGKTLVPTVTSSNGVFGSSSLSPSQRLMVPDSIETNTLVEYTSEAGKPQYGKIIKTKKGRRGQVTVQELTDKEAQAEQEKTQGKIYSLSTSNIRAYKPPGVVGTVLSMLDPSENIVIKIITFLLVGNIFESSDTMDIFMKLYLRFIVLAAIVIAVAILISHFSH